MRSLFSPRLPHQPACSIVTTFDTVINCFTFNARSIVNKLPDFQAFISAYETDCVAITETWLNSEIPDSLFINTSQYRVYRKDIGSRGGGVCLLV
jgi:hypothetical protein